MKNQSKLKTFSSLTIFVKNMVCDRCIKVVKEELDKLNLTISSIKLGEVELNESLTNKKITEIERVLKENGFELLSGNKTKTIEKIKNTIINLIHYPKQDSNENEKISRIIEKELGLEYHYLSSLFSSIEQMTIEQFTILQKIEKAKELLKYDELTLGEISYRLGYSSVQHLSNQFKKTTGLTASQFKKMTNAERKPLDSVGS